MQFQYALKKLVIYFLILHFNTMTTNKRLMNAEEVLQVILGTRYKFNVGETVEFLILNWTSTAGQVQGTKGRTADRIIFKIYILHFSLILL